jgi:ribose transport system permease protein
VTTSTPPVAQHPGPTAESGGERSAAARFWRSLTRTTTGQVYLALIAILVVCWVVVAIKGSNLLSIDSIADMLIRSVALGIVAAGQTLVIIGMSLDLSVAWVISLTSIVAAVVMDGSNANIAPGILVVLALGMAIGLVNGLVITKLRVNPFIATLGVALIIQGFIESRWDGVVEGVPGGFEDSLGYSEIGPLPIAVLLLVAVYALVWFLLRYTRFGHQLYAVGGSEEVSKLSGVRTHRILIMAHVICSLCAAVTGLYLAARLGAGSPLVGTDGGYDLESIAAVVLGGTYLLGGRGSVLGTLAGVFILAILDSTFNALEVNAFAKDVVRGVIIIVAVAAYSFRWKERRVRKIGAGPAPAVTGNAPQTQTPGANA